MDRKTNIFDVAALASVSTATVSRVLNEPAKVKPETTLRVKQAIAQLGYEPNIQARNLRRFETRDILVVQCSLTNPFLSGVLEGISDTLRQKKYHALVCHTHRQEGLENEFLEMLNSRKADGAILLTRMKNPGRLMEIAQHVPVVQCAEYYPELPLPRVSIDNHAAARHAVEYLIGLGHKKIAMVSSENNELSTLERMRGYLEALKRHGLPEPQEYIQYCDPDYGFDSSVEAARRLLQLPEPPTAVFCIADVVALGAVRAAQLAGKNVPEDVTVMGFDNIEFAAYVSPLMTTVEQNRRRLGTTAAQMLLDQLEERPGPAPRQVVLEHSIIVRESSGPPKQA